MSNPDPFALLGKAVCDRVTEALLVVVGVQLTECRAIKYAARMVSPGDRRDIDRVLWFTDRELKPDVGQVIERTVKQVDFKPGDNVNLMTEFGSGSFAVQSIIYWCWGDTDLLLYDGSRVSSNEVLGVDTEDNL